MTLKRTPYCPLLILAFEKNRNFQEAKNIFEKALKLSETKGDNYRKSILERDLLRIEKTEIDESNKNNQDNNDPIATVLRDTKIRMEG